MFFGTDPESPFRRPVSSALASISASEVVRVHTVTMDEVDADPRFVTDPRGDSPILQWPFHDLDIHAPTAPILYQFREVVLRQQHTRVAHYGQPVFAWQ